MGGSGRFRPGRAVQAAADTLRANPRFDARTVITELAVGEALVSFLDDKGMPGVVERAFVLPPQSSLTPLTEAERDSRFQGDSLYPTYKDMVDNHSAYEALQELGAQNAAAAEQAAQTAEAAKTEKAAAAQQATEAEKPGMVDGLLGGLFGSRKKSNQGIAYDLADSVGKQVNRQVTNAISRSVMGVIRNMLK